MVSHASLLYFKRNFINVFTFDCAGSSLLGGLFSSFREQGLLSSCGAWASHCGGFSCCGAQTLGSRASAVVAHGISCFTAREIGPGIEPVSPTLADRFLITGPPGTPLSFYVNISTPCAVHLNWHLQSLNCVRLFVTPWQEY